MEELIRQAFLHVEGIGPHVQEGHYDLVGPTGEIILPRVWELLVEPGWSVTMHMWPMPEPGKRRPGDRGHRGPPPPPPGNWPGGRPPPPPPGWPGKPPGPSSQRPPQGSGVGGPPIIVMRPDASPAKSRTGMKPKGADKGVSSWVAGKPNAKSSKRMANPGGPREPDMEPESSRLRGGGGRRASFMDFMSGANPKSSKKGTFVTRIMKSTAS